MSETRTDKEALAARIATFLETFVENGNSDGWPDIAETDLEEMHAIFLAIRDAKFATDCDGKPVVQIDVVDRTRSYQYYAPSVPHLHGLEGEAFDAAVLQHIDAASAMASGSSEILRSLKSDIDIRKRMRPKTGA